MPAQLSLFPEIDEKEVRRKVASELKLFKAIRVAVENQKELEEQGVSCLFPSMRSKDEEVICKLKYRQMQRALEKSLDTLEREVIERKYLGPERVKDITVYIEMGIDKDLYYTVKKQAIFQIATALGII
ncbi:ArpU family phage packaging/lysis transcriptional regulator [Bacillus tianshenii]|nr:ArpU family phage packaging/lysis transcriptional regulator [Bacillus tianshenii]